MAIWYLLLRRGDVDTDTGDRFIDSMRVTNGQLITYKSRAYLLSKGMDVNEAFPMRGEGNPRLKCIQVNITDPAKLNLLEMLMASDPQGELNDSTKPHWRKRMNHWKRSEMRASAVAAIFASDTEVISMINEDQLIITNFEQRFRHPRVQLP